jgi:hypothetical protein
MPLWNDDCAQASSRHLRLFHPHTILHMFGQPATHQQHTIRDRCLERDGHRTAATCAFLWLHGQQNRADALLILV